MGHTPSEGRLPANGLTKESSLKEEEYSELENAFSDTKRQYLQRGLSSEEADFLLSLSEKEKSQIYWKVDIRLVPMLALLYLVSHLDRANIGNAKIEGLEADLGMSGIDYNIAVFIFFIPNILCALPSNFILGKFKKPSTYIGSIVIAWGLVVLIGGFVQNLAGLATIRFFIGVFEAGFFPGSMWLITQWYEPRRTGLRMSMFYFSSAASGAFSGLLAAGIAQMDGLGGLGGWRWIFIMEGIVSVLIGISCFFLLPDTPSLSGRWLQPGEIKFLNLIHQATRGSTLGQLADAEQNKQTLWQTLRQVAMDGKIYLQVLVYTSNSVPNYAFKFTMPQIIRNMGFTSTNAQLLTAPPYLLGAINAVVVSALGDRCSMRSPFILGPQSLVIVAYSVLFVKAANIGDNIALCYAMVTIACMGIYPIIPVVNSWTINNLAGAEKRNIGTAYFIMWGTCGGIVGSFIFQESESPHYPTGFGTSLAFGAAGICSVFIVSFLYHRHNKKYEGMTEEEAEAKFGGPDKLKKMGDSSPLFKYSL